jgi:hypothetical protein
MLYTWRNSRRSHSSGGRRVETCVLALEVLEERTLLSWNGYAHDPQHTAISPVPSQSFDTIRWQTPVDLNPQYSGTDLFIHYGSPLVTDANTVIVPVKTGASGGFRVEGHSGVDGSLKWMVSSDYILPPHNWTPSYSPTLTPTNRLYFAGAGGTVYYLDNPDANGAATTGQIAFYGIANYSHSLDSRVYINTPITSDSAGDIFFGFRVTGSNSLNLVSGIARIGADGTGSWVSATAAAGDNRVTKVAQNSAPALSNDGSIVYVAVNGSAGYLLALDSTTLATVSRVLLLDPRSSTTLASVSDDGTASPTVGPDGDVYFGVLENPFNHHDRGWLLHFSGDLTQTKIPGGFGWDDTASVVPATMVPSYTGSSTYLLMTKYNDYAGQGGTGINKIAVIDPNDSQPDFITGTPVMKDVLTIAGVTPDPDFPDHPGAVREWCINTAAVDPYTDSILANSEDGMLYRWNLSSNAFSQVMPLTTATGEAYTPTVVGANGAVYAINNATLFAIQGPGGPVIRSGVASSPNAPVNSFRVTFSEPVDPNTFTLGQIPSFFGPAGPIAVTAITPVSGSNNTQFDITFPNQTALGIYTMVIGPNIVDLNGNAMDQNDNGVPGEYPDDQYIAHFTIAGPKIVASTPVTNQYAPVYSVRVTFSEPMNPATFTPAKILSFSGPNGAISVIGVAPVAGSNNTRFDITFAPQGTTGVYQMLIGPDIRDMAGHQMDQNGNFVEGEIPGDMYYLHFGIRGPRITTSTPTGNHFGPISSVRVTFDESMDPATFTPDKVASFTGPGGAIAITNVAAVAGSNNTQFDIFFAGQTGLGNYTMVIGPNIRDTFGNQMDQNGNLVPGEIPGDQFTTQFTVVSTTIGPDGFGYEATVHPFENLEIVNDPGAFTLIDSGNSVSVPVHLFANTVSFYGVTYTGNNQLFVSSKGLLTFGGSFSDPTNTDLTTTPNLPTVAVLWSDWRKNAGDLTGPMVLGEFDQYDGNGVPHRLIIEWNQVHHNGSSGTLTFQVILALNTDNGVTSDIVLNYPSLQSGDSWAEGHNVTVGIKDTGTQGNNRLLVDFNSGTPFVGTGQAILFFVPSTGISIQGVAVSAVFPGVSPDSTVWRGPTESLPLTAPEATPADTGASDGFFDAATDLGAGWSAIAKEENRSLLWLWEEIDAGHSADAADLG